MSNKARIFFSPVMFFTRMGLPDNTTDPVAEQSTLKLGRPLAPVNWNIQQNNETVVTCADILEY